ncbi:MAG: hypothetical protein AAGG68_07940 [Bacteroidota bacterium]
MIFEESRLQFEFDETAWKQVVHYDQEKDYGKLKNSIKNTKGVDFIGIQLDQHLVLMEVKNFREDEKLLKEKLLQSDELLNGFAQKIRDTLPGMLASARNSTHKRDFYKDCITIIENIEKRVDAVFWLEPHPEMLISDSRKKATLQVLSRKLKKKLKWLTGRVLIISETENPYPIIVKPI